MSSIGDLIRQLAGAGLPANSVFCTIKSVDEEGLSCRVETVSSTLGVELDEVSLMPDVTDGFTMVPAVGSTVVVQYSKEMPPHIIMFGELAKVIMVVGDSSLSLEPDKIAFNNGDFGGLIKIRDLVDRLNKLETAYNELQGKFNNHVHTGVQTGGGSSGTTPTPSSSSVDQTTVEQIENALITHGSSI